MDSEQLHTRNSWVYDELHTARNIRPSFHFGGLYGGLIYSALDTYIFRGKAPWTFKQRLHDHEHLHPASRCTKTRYPKPDGIVTFDLNTSLFRSGTNHEHDQLPHLKLRNPKLPTAVNLAIYDGPETRYCPAGVYEYVTDKDSKERLLHINAQNCLHCKACDIKDPTQNILWTVPEGGGGPHYNVL